MAVSSTGHLAYPVLDGLGLPGCSFCRHATRRDHDAAWSFLYEGKHAPEVRSAVRAAGGFCAHHAGLVLTIALRDDLTAGLAEVYEHLIAADLARIGARPATPPTPTARCYLCIGRTESESRMATFVADRLTADPDARAAYGRSAGFCLPHLRLVAAQAEPATARALLADAAVRMRALSLSLSEYRRKRDYRNAGEPKGDEQLAAIEATRRYSGG